MAFHENRWRSIVKTLTFRALVLIADVTAIFFITKSVEIVLIVIVVTNITSTVIFFFHERAWNRIHWGKTKLRGR